MPEDAPVDEQVDADDRRVLERALLRRRRVDDEVGVERVRVVDADAGEHRRARRLQRTMRRLAVDLAERRDRQDEVARRAPRAQRRRDGEESGRGVHLVHPEVQRGPEEDLPEAVDRRLGLPLGAQELAEGAASGPEACDPCREGDDPQPVGQGDVPVAEKRQEPVADRRDAAALVDRRQRERLAAHVPGRADPLQEAQVRGEAAERDVLAVVGRRVGIALARRQRLHLAAEGRARLVERHVVARIDELERRGEPGQPAADHSRLHRRSPAPTTRSFASGDSRTEPPKTSNPSASIRSRVAR